MHDHLIDDASSVERKSKGRLRSVGLLLTAVVAMVTVVAGVAGTAGAVAPATNPTAITVETTGLVQSVKVSWNLPSNTDNVAGYVVTPHPVAPTTEAQTPPKVSVTGVNTLTVTVTNLAAGGTYTFTVQSVGTASETNGPGVTSGAITANGPVVAAPPGPYVFPSFDATIKRHFQEFLQRDPNLSELIFWRTYFTNTSTQVGTCGAPHPVQLAVDPAKTNAVGPFCPNSGPEFNLLSWLIYGDTNAFDSGGYAGPTDTGRNTYAGIAEPVARLYQAYFLRTPDFGGLKFWMKKFAGGRSLDNISAFFAGSTEFQRTYGALSNDDFVTLVYNNVLARVEDFGGQNYWRGQLDSGKSRGFVMTRFSESNEYKRNVNYNIKTTTLYAALLGITPSQAQLDATVASMNSSWDAFCFDKGLQNEGQTIVLAGTATTFSLTFNGQTTVSLAAAATAAQVDTALENLTTIGAGNVVVTAGPAGTYYVTFTGTLGNANQPELTGTAPASSIAITTNAPGGPLGSDQVHYSSVSLNAAGTRTNLGGTATIVSSSPNPCSGTAFGLTDVYIVATATNTTAYYVSPIQQLIATIRNSPAYTAVIAAGKAPALSV